MLITLAATSMSCAIFPKLIPGATGERSRIGYKVRSYGRHEFERTPRGCCGARYAFGRFPIGQPRWPHSRLLESRHGVSALAVLTTKAYMKPTEAIVPVNFHRETAEFVVSVFALAALELTKKFMALLHEDISNDSARDEANALLFVARFEGQFAALREQLSVMRSIEPCLPMRPDARLETSLLQCGIEQIEKTQKMGSQILEELDRIGWPAVHDAMPEMLSKLIAEIGIAIASIETYTARVGRGVKL